MVNTVEIPELATHLAPSCQLLRGMANRDRLNLLCGLVQGEKTVTELGSMTGIRQPSLSQQLGVLRNEGMVQASRMGNHIRYSISNPLVITMMQLLYEHYCKKSFKEMNHEL
jgi:DNA-binding transcriptional ArsR family regulator